MKMEANNVTRPRITLVSLALIFLSPIMFSMTTAENHRSSRIARLSDSATLSDLIIKYDGVGLSPSSPQNNALTDCKW